MQALHASERKPEFASGEKFRSSGFLLYVLVPFPLFPFIVFFFSLIFFLVFLPFTLYDPELTGQICSPVPTVYLMYMHF